jgi:hypothetical protein
MPESLFAFTYDSDEMVTLTLTSEDAADFHALPRLPREEPDGFEAPDVIITDVVTGRTYMVSRFPCGADCGCAAYAEDITENWEEFLADEEAAG